VYNTRACRTDGQTPADRRIASRVKMLLLKCFSWFPLVKASIRQMRTQTTVTRSMGTVHLYHLLPKMFFFFFFFIYLFIYLFISFLPSFVPSFLPSFIPSFLPSFIPSFLPSFLPSFFLSFFQLLRLVRVPQDDPKHFGTAGARFLQAGCLCCHGDQHCQTTEGEIQ